MLNTIAMVVGSWGSYNECNEKALGSKWINFDLYDSWEEVEKKLKKEGFDLEGLDSELFIQDLECEFEVLNCDHRHPKHFFEVIQESEILLNPTKFKMACAIVEAEGFDFWQNLVINNSNWDSEYLLHSCSKYDYGYNKITECVSIPSWIENYIDFEQVAQDDIDDGYLTETSYGLLEQL